MAYGIAGIVVLVLLLRLFTPYIKGIIGEKSVDKICASFPKEKFRMENDVLLPGKSGTTQIDHVLVSTYGIFVIETKNYAGWIYGSLSGNQWTQNIYGKKSRFMNPLHQNYAHTKALEALISGTAYQAVPIIPIVAFSNRCELKIQDRGENVVYFSELRKAIQNKCAQEFITEDEMVPLASAVKAGNIKGVAKRIEHIADVRSQTADRQSKIAERICPRCGGTLVLRNGKSGAFWGCGNYPKCRFTAPLETTLETPR